MELKKATRQAKRIRFAILAPSGSGKTWTGLRLCRELAGPQGRVIVIDTEHGSASMYAGEPEAAGDFETIELDSFSPENYQEALKLAARENADAVMIDSLSHAWAGKDGLLEFVDKEALKNKGDSFGAGWRKATPKHNALIESMLSAPFHLVVTMRVKMEYVVEKNSQGKNVPRKIGMQPVQRDGLEYEFDAVADMDIDHNLMIGKTRIKALDGKTFEKPRGEVADIIKAWLAGGAPANGNGAATPSPATEAGPQGQLPGSTPPPDGVDATMAAYRERLRRAAERMPFDKQDVAKSFIALWGQSRVDMLVPEKATAALEDIERKAELFAAMVDTNRASFEPGSEVKKSYVVDNLVEYLMNAAALDFGSKPLNAPASMWETWAAELAERVGAQT